jgi:hypothetical protein
MPSPTKLAKVLLTAIAGSLSHDQSLAAPRGRNAMEPASRMNFRMIWIEADDAS